MEDHEVYNADNLDKVFKKLDLDGNGTLCQREVATFLGDDHEFCRELLEQIKKTRGTLTDASELAMTLAEFKTLMMKDNAPAPTVGAATRGRRRQQGPVTRSEDRA